MQRALQNITGVVRVNVADRKDDSGIFEVDTEKGADVRREMATTIVRGGWGLLELRPVRASLEDIFLSLTTAESATGETIVAGNLSAEAAAKAESGEVAGA